MKKLIAAASIAVSLALVGVGGAQATDKPDKPDKDKIAKACHDLKKADKAAFKETYGPKKAMRNCKKGEEPAADETTPASSRMPRRHAALSERPTPRRSRRPTARTATRRTRSANAFREGQGRVRRGRFVTTRGPSRSKTAAASSGRGGCSRSG